MATEKLADGIRKFAVDLKKLEKMVTDKLSAHFEWYLEFYILAKIVWWKNIN